VHGMEIEWGHEISSQVETLRKEFPETGETADFFGKQYSKQRLKILSFNIIKTN
jgi:hypothetical protein